jgi:hypothetical protein
MKPLAARLFASILMVTSAATAEGFQPPSEPDGMLTFRPHATLSRRQFVIEGREAPATAAVGVFRIGKGKRTRLQTLHGPKAHHGQIELLEETTWRVEDLNFDCYLDGGLLWSKSAIHYYWLFDPNTGRFVLNEPLGELPNIDVDRKRRVLSSHETHRFGCAEYRWRKGKLVRTKYVSEEEGLRINAEGR